MNRKLGLWLLLIGFVVLSAEVVWTYGYLGVYERILANGATALAAVDLLIAFGLILVWLVRDARERGASPLPYVLLTVALGSAGPLLYLIRRDRDRSTASLPVGALASRVAR